MSNVTSETLSRPGTSDAGQTALEELFRVRYGDFLRVAAAITGSSEAARDAVQEGLARALVGRSSFRGSGTLEAWLWSTVVNAARNQRARSPLVAEASDEAASVAPPEDERRDSVRAAVASLPERQRLVLFLRYYADLDYASIGAALGIRRGTVSATLNQAHSAMRRVLDEEVT
jgi:RNA polymerase sigma factor (sigma-70 family)